MAVNLSGSFHFPCKVMVTKYFVENMSTVTPCLPPAGSWDPGRMDKQKNSYNLRDTDNLSTPDNGHWLTPE